MRKIVFAGKALVIAGLVFGLATTTQAATVNLGFEKLNGTVADGTSVYRANLGSLGFNQLTGLTLQDSSSRYTFDLFGAFSGIDLDGIKLSNTWADSATAASNALSINAFDFSSAGTSFNAGQQKGVLNFGDLSGTQNSGTEVSSSVTLNNFDSYNRNSSVSLGYNGSISFSLLPGVMTENLFLYVGESGHNSGESFSGYALGTDVSPVPIPGAIWLFSSALMGFGFISRKKKIA